MANILRRANRFKGGKDEDARMVMSLVGESRQILQDQHEGWFYDIAFFRGHQWTYRDRNVGRLQQIPVSPWRIRLTDNQTRPLVTQMLALLIEHDPTFKAVARGHEEEDVLAAMGYEALLRHDWDRLDLSHKLEEALLWMLVTGNGFWRVAWNPAAGKPLLVPVQEGADTMAAKDAPQAESKEPKGEPEDDDFFVPGLDQTEPTEFQQLLHEGDVDVSVVSPFNIDMQSTASSLRTAGWISQQAFIHRDVLIDRIGNKAKDIVPDANMEEYNAYDRQLRFDHAPAAGSSDDSSEQVRVIEFWESPTKKHPEGRVITVAGQKTLSAKPGPYGGRHPFVHFGCNPVPGRFWHDGIVRELIPLQQGHNKALSRYHMIMMLSANPKVIADKESGIKDNAVNDQPGEIIFKRRGTDVRFESPAAVSPIHPQIMSLAMNSMQGITGVNDPLAGQNPPNVRAGIAIRQLQESGMRRFVPITRRTETALRRAGRMLLYLHKRYFNEDKVLQVLGTDAEPESYYMNRASVDRIEDVTVAPGSLKPESPAAKQDMVIQLLQYAPFLFAGQGGSLDTAYILRMLDMPSVSGDLGVKRRQRMRAYREHIELMEGRGTSVFPWDDDMLHLEIHGARLSDDKWAEENPEAAQALAQHYAEHEANMQQKMGGAMLDIHGAPPEGPTSGRSAAPSGPLSSQDGEGGLPGMGEGS